jgi:ubiquinone/menaquinone biosynthesis C-methylase UbiE
MNIYRTKKFAEIWHEHTKKDFLRINMMNEIMEKEIGNLKGKIVLEAGCGDGFFIPNLLKKKPKKVIGIDISKYLVEIAKREIISENVEFYQMDLTKKLNFRNNFFDVIVSYNVLQEIKDISTPLREMKRVLKKGGKLIISITHPLYHLFVSALETKDLPPLESLKRYSKIEPIHSTAIKGFEKHFVVWRKPISHYVNEIVKNKLKIIKMRDIIIPPEIGKISQKHKERVGLPIFLLFKLEK